MRTLIHALAATELANGTNITSHFSILFRSEELKPVYTPKRVIPACL